MVKIKMLQTRKGSPDGFVVNEYLKDKTYTVRESLAREFFANGWAVKVIE